MKDIDYNKYIAKKNHKDMMIDLDKQYNEDCKTHYQPFEILDHSSQMAYPNFVLDKNAEGYTKFMSFEEWVEKQGLANNDIGDKVK